MSDHEFDPFADMALSATNKAAARKQLSQLAEQSENSALREMARDVLSGKVNLRGAMTSPRITELLDEGMSRFSGWYRELTPAERAEHEQHAQEYAEDARRTAAAPAERRPGQRPPASPEDDWEDQTILKKRRR